MLIEIKWSKEMICPLRGDKCAGDFCGGWRWFDPPEPELLIIEHSEPLAVTEPDVRPKDVPRDYEFWPCDPTEGTDACWFESDREAERRRRGYCGLAGKPEFTE